MAARYYSRQLRSTEFPSWLRLPEVVEKPFVELDVSLEDGVVQTLEREARSRNVDLQQLLNHAVFVYLADLDRHA